MALTANPTIGTIVRTDEGSNTPIIDSTTYGGVNDDRNEVSVHLLAYKVDEDLEETALTVEEFDPTDVEEFTVQNSEDGHQKFIMFIIPLYAGLTSYPMYSVVYHTATERIYYNNSGSTISGITPGADSSWTALDLDEVYELLDTNGEPENLVYTILQTVLTFEAQACLGLKASSHAKANCSGCSEDPKAKDEFDELWLLVYMASVAATRQKYTEGERFMRAAEKYCDCNC